MAVIDEEYESSNDTISEVFQKRCPVKVGDVFYHRKPNMTMPDRLKVLEIKKVDDTFYIKAKYMYHAIGPFERTFSDIIFKDPDWVIE